MEHEQLPSSVTIHDEVFDIVKPTRLLPGMVLHSTARDVFARLGPKESTIEEQIHTVSLHERGFPVANVLESGEYGDSEWYFTEESLGKDPFHTQFTREYEQTGSVSEETFSRYLSVLQRYIDAQFAASNRTTITAREFVETAVPANELIDNYYACGGDIDRYVEAMAKATDRLHDVSMGVLQFDLNPFNVLDRGMIDFELVGYGPLGYDTLLVSLWHRWFTSDQESRYHIAYVLSPEQIEQASMLVATAAEQAHVEDPHEYMQEFLLIKTAWGFTSKKPIHEEPDSKQAFYHYRAALLSHAVDAYLSSQPIDVLAFPQMHAHEPISATHPIQPIQ